MQPERGLPRVLDLVRRGDHVRGVLGGRPAPCRCDRARGRAARGRHLGDLLAVRLGPQGAAPHPLEPERAGDREREDQQEPAEEQPQPAVDARASPQGPRAPRLRSWPSTTARGAARSTVARCPRSPLERPLGAGAAVLGGAVVVGAAVVGVVGRRGRRARRRNRRVGGPGRRIARRLARRQQEAVRGEQMRHAPGVGVGRAQEGDRLGVRVRQAEPRGLAPRPCWRRAAPRSGPGARRSASSARRSAARCGRSPR